MATITEVAQHAGVSIKTVSRVMNNYQHISSKTRERVEHSMQELQYSPSSIARQMRLGDTFSIGMLCGDPSSGYQARLNHAVLKACSDARRYLVVDLFDEKSSEWLSQVEAFLDRTKVKNLILVPPMCDSLELHALLEERGVNFVLISPSQSASSASAVTMDDRLAAKEITNHLIGLGHVRIGHIGGHPDHVASLLRRQGFEEALTMSGLCEANADLIETGRFRFRVALDLADKMLTCENPPSAIFAANDEMAAAVVMTANRLGLRVPEDLSVAGFDDAPISQTIWPELTTIAQPFDAIAADAIRCLAANRDGSKEVSQTLVLPHKLLVRASTASRKR